MNIDEYVNQILNISKKRIKNEEKIKLIKSVLMDFKSGHYNFIGNVLENGFKLLVKEVLDVKDWDDF